jgi:hypothetical protein
MRKFFVRREPGERIYCFLCIFGVVLVILALP